MEFQRQVSLLSSSCSPVYKFIKFLLLHSAVRETCFLKAADLPTSRCAVIYLVGLNFCQTHKLVLRGPFRHFLRIRHTFYTGTHHDIYHIYVVWFVTRARYAHPKWNTKRGLLSLYYLLDNKGTDSDGSCAVGMPKKGPTYFFIVCSQQRRRRASNPIKSPRSCIPRREKI
jgi:hypothetical protein